MQSSRREKQRARLRRGKTRIGHAHEPVNIKSKSIDRIKYTLILARSHRHARERSVHGATVSRHGASSRGQGLRPCAERNLSAHVAVMQQNRGHLLLV